MTRSVLAVCATFVAAAVLLGLIADADGGMLLPRQFKERCSLAEGADLLEVPDWGGCADVLQSHKGANPSLHLRCQMGVITDVLEALLGRPSGRCDAEAFAIDDPADRAERGVGYARETDESLCPFIDLRQVLAAKCLAKMECSVTLDQLKQATNAHDNICNGELLRAVARFRCSLPNRNDNLLGAGVREGNYFDPEETPGGRAQRLADEADRRGYVMHDPVVKLAAGPQRAWACGFAYEADFTEVECSAPPRLPAAPDPLDALDMAVPEAAVASGELVVRNITVAHYGKFTTGYCDASIDPSDSSTFPEAECGQAVVSQVEAQCLGRRKCLVYVPTVGVGDPCPGRKKGLLVIARCGPAP
jgi:hypothetical protein